MSETRVLDVMNIIVKTVLNSGNSLPFAYYTSGGKEEDNMHYIELDWNGHHFDVIGEELHNSITFGYKEESFVLRNVTSGWCNNRIEDILNVFFPEK